MNTKSIALAIALAAGTAFAASVQASDIPTLETVQVRPSADQLAQAEHERTSAIPTLSAVQVRPTAGQIVERNAELAATRPVVTLAAIQVRPTREQRQALAAETTHDNRDHPVAQRGASPAAPSGRAEPADPGHRRRRRPARPLSRPHRWPGQRRRKLRR
jgi:TolA-binding protein